MPDGVGTIVIPDDQVEVYQASGWSLVDSGDDDKSEEPKAKARRSHTKS